MTTTDGEICAGESTTLSVNTVGVGPFTYAWSPGGGNKADTIVSPSVTTDYSVTVTNAGNATVHNISVVVSPAVPATPSVTGSTSVCEK